MITSACAKQFLGLCLVIPPAVHGTLFGFAEFTQALALLVIVYTVTDVRYRFRIAVAPIPLWPITFAVTAVIGIGTLFSDLWFRLQLPLPDFLVNQFVWQATFGGLFLVIIMIWIWYGFIHPPVFGNWNRKNFARTLFSYILRGSDRELPAIAAELARSADALVRHASESHRRLRGVSPPAPKRMETAEYAHDLLLLLGNRKLCRSIIAAAPGTAIVFFDAMSRQKKYWLPLGQFASNITAEAVNNKDSILYHEDAGYFSGLIGYIKPFSNALYGNFDLVEALASNNQSPLDVNYQVRGSWDATQANAYARAVLTTFGAYLKEGRWQHSYALYRAFDDVKEIGRDIYKLDRSETGVYETDVFRRFDVVADFLRDTIRALDEQPEVLPTVLRHRASPMPLRDDMYDVVANFAFELIFSASAVTSPDGTCWMVQYNTAWNACFGFERGAAAKIVRFKLRRLLYDEIVQLSTLPNYKSASILGLCLNVMGLTVHRASEYGIEWRALHKAILNWTKKNYLNVRNHLPDVAAACLVGGITFDEVGHRLIKTYRKGLEREAPKDFLNLDPATAK